MRIALFSEAYSPQVNGVVTTQRKLIPYLRSRGHQVLLVVPRYKSNERSTDVVEFQALPLPLYPEMPVILPHWKFHVQKLAQVEAFKPELVHLMTWGVLGFFGQKWARRNRVPVVASYETDIIHYLGYYGFGMFKPQAWRYLRWLFNNCSRTYVPSQETKEFLEANGICRVEVFDRGVDCDCFHPAKRSERLRKSLGVVPGDVLLLYVGRVSKEKNLPWLLRWFTMCSRRRPNVRLVITGDGPLRRRLIRQFAHPQVIFTGWKQGEELSTLFASADIFAMPSSTETLSLVSLEAMASGVPVLAMNVGGVRTIVEHDKTGLLANSREEFGTFLDRLVEDAPFRSQFGPTGRRSAESKTWAHAFEYLENSYEQVLSERESH